MKLRLHHIEICVKDPTPVVTLLRSQFGLNLVGVRESQKSIQYVLKLAKTAFVVTSRKGKIWESQNNNSDLISISEKEVQFDHKENWDLFCCPHDLGDNHIDSVFNVAIEVVDLTHSLVLVRESGAKIVKDIQHVAGVDFAVIKSCCGNVVHTLIQKRDYKGWFLPGFTQVEIEKPNNQQSHINGITMSHFDHFTLACRVGETDEIIEWYERAFGMKRFITNRDDSETEGLVIGDDVGLRLKVMEFWKCAESGIASQAYENSDHDWEPLKIVIAESLPNISNTQIESFITEHGGPGIQHVGLHTENMVDTVRELTKQGVKFRHPPPTYYTDIGQLSVIESSGEDLETLRSLGILLDNEADVFDQDFDPSEDRYLMQVFTHPVFKDDTFFLEVIQRKGARGFGIGNVSALARSVNAYKQMLLENEQRQQKIN